MIFRDKLKGKGKSKRRKERRQEKVFRKERYVYYHGSPESDRAG